MGRPGGRGDGVRPYFWCVVKAMGNNSVRSHFVQDCKKTCVVLNIVFCSLLLEILCAMFQAFRVEGFRGVMGWHFLAVDGHVSTGDTGKGKRKFDRLSDSAVDVLPLYSWRFRLKK